MERITWYKHQNYITMNIQSIIDRERARAQTEANDTPELWPYYSQTAAFKYSTRTGFDKSKVVNIVFYPFQVGKYLYFAKNKQTHSHYIMVYDTETLKYDIITYASKRTDAKYWIDLIRKNPDNQDPAKMKLQYYNGSGSKELCLH